MWACALAWAGSALVFVVMLVSVAVLLAAPDMLIDELNRQNPELREDGMTSETLRRTVLYAGSLLVVWSVVASVVAVVRVARPALGLEDACWSPRAAPRDSALLAAIGSPAMLVPLACAGSPSRCCCGPRCGRSCAAAADRS